MNFKDRNLKIEIKDAIEQIRDAILEDDDLEEQAIRLVTSTEPEIDDEDLDDLPLTGILTLRGIPISDWDAICVSPLSKFGDAIWDFTSYPHAQRSGARFSMTNIGHLKIDLAEPEYKHWERITKALTFYCVPHFNYATNIRSYGSLRSQKTKTTRLLKLFREENLYLGEVGSQQFRTLDDLSWETVQSFIDNIASPSEKWELAHSLRNWQRISHAHLLPTDYSIHRTFVTKDELSKYRKEYDEGVIPWMPIQIDEYARIIDYCMRLVKDYSQDVLWLYRTFYPAIVGGYEHVDRGALLPGGFGTGSKEGVAAFISYKPVTHNGQPWWPLQVQQRTQNWETVSKPWGFLPDYKIISLVTSLMDACLVILLATTGMRRSEALTCRTGCVTKDTHGYWLAFTEFKTSIGSQGKTRRVPIPEIAEKAVSVLKALGREARTYGGHDYLFTNINRVSFGQPKSFDYAGTAIRRIADATGCSEPIHPHRFRKTLATYLVYQDPHNIELVRQLFGHSSLKMTIRYVLSLPGVNHEIKKIIAEQNIDVLTELLDSALKGKIGGEAGKRLKKTIEKSPFFQGRLQDKGKETLVQYVDRLLEQGIKMIHRTNLAICMKTPGLVESAPCDTKDDDTAMKLHPNLFACNPFNCRFAAFVEANIPALQNEILFHNNLIQRPGSSPKQKAYSDRRIAEAFKRLAEMGEQEAHDFVVKVANG